MGSLRRVPVLFAATLLATGLLTGCGGEQTTDPSAGSAAPVTEPVDETPMPVASGPNAEQVAANNRAVGLMGRFDYAAAHAAFAELVAERPDWRVARINLAIATLNRQHQGDEQAALAMADAIVRDHPGDLHGEYLAGLLRLYLASPDQALAHFERVVDGDPDDAYAAYYLAQCRFQRNDLEAALDGYRRALQLDPYLRSAYYGAFQVLRKLGRRSEARAMVADYQRLANNPRARLAEFKYTRMGDKAVALTVDTALPANPLPRPGGALFGARQDLEQLAGGVDRSSGVGIGRADLGGAAGPLVLVAGAGRGSGADGDPNRVYQVEQGRLVARPGHPLGAVTRVNAALWGDYDNDGLTDVYLLRRGPNALWRQHPAGQWHPVTAATETAGGDFDSVDGLFVDADHDGDLDLYLVNADGPNELLNNDQNGRFRPIAAAQGIAADDSSRQALAVDLDGDRDLDLVVINRRPVHRVYRNDRLWAYRAAPGFDAFVQADIQALVAGDPDGDGRVALYSSDADGRLSRWRPDRNGTWVAEPLGRIALLAGDRPQLALADADGDGVLELFAGSAAGWSLVRLDPQLTQLAGHKAEVPLAGWRPILLDPARGPALLAVDQGGRTALWPAGPGRYPMLVLSLSGMADPGQAMRSNASGIGARVAVRRGSHWSLLHSPAPDSAAGQDLAPLVVGLAGAPTADFVSIDWSDGVLQTELDLAPGRAQRITETQRQLSSCPLLFAWDGRRYRFVSDLLGVGGVGYLVGPGVYAPSRPWENFLLPAGLAQSRDGRYQLKVAEPMEETAYLDAARLVAYDLPPGWDLVLDERMGINDPQPTGQVRYIREQRLPQRVLGPGRVDLTQTLRAADGKAAPVGPLDRRFIGRLRQDRQLTLEFDRDLADGPGEPLLIVDGWVEYPYSQTQFAAWQAGAAYRAPSLDVRGADGRWRPLLVEFGYPAGMPRRMSVPLAGLPAGTRALRLTTNMEVYWDRIAVGYAEQPPPLRRQPLRLAAARLRSVGFPRRSTGPQRYPDYDYQQRTPFWDVNYQSGWYTRPGPVEELVAEQDDAVALIGPGDEVHLSFDAPADPPPAGWSRRLVLETHGWAKDRDLFTRDGETVAPLPSTGKPRGPVEQLHARYNTRLR